MTWVSVFIGREEAELDFLGRQLGEAEMEGGLVLGTDGTKDKVSAIL